jgi:hypothetical protein
LLSTTAWGHLITAVAVSLPCGAESTLFLISTSADTEYVSLNIRHSDASGARVRVVVVKALEAAPLSWQMSWPLQRVWARGEGAAEQVTQGQTDHA